MAYILMVEAPVNLQLTMTEFVLVFPGLSSPKTAADRSTSHLTVAGSKLCWSRSGHHLKDHDGSP